MVVQADCSQGCEGGNNLLIGRIKGNDVSVFVQGIDQLEHTDDVAAAAFLGGVIAKKALDAGIESVVFDRGGYIYHGKIQALADAAREAGLKF